MFQRNYRVFLTRRPGMTLKTMFSGVSPLARSLRRPMAVLAALIVLAGMVGTANADISFLFGQAAGLAPGISGDNVGNLGTPSDTVVLTGSSPNSVNLGAGYVPLGPGAVTLDASSVSVLTVSGTQQIVTIGSYALEIFAPAGNPVALAIGSGAQLTETISGSHVLASFANTGTYGLFTVFGTFTGVNPGDLTLSLVGAKGAAATPFATTFTIPNGSVAGTSSAPEPSTFVVWGLLGGIGLCVARFRRRSA
jgi:hypothetical protein